MFEREVNPRNVTQADVVIGFATYKEADSIAVPTKVSDQGLSKYFADRKCVLMTCDNNSPDDTEGAFLSVETDNPKIYISTPPGIAGKGYNFENMFRRAIELGAKCVVCIDGDILSITPEWIQYFVGAVDAGFDLATPLYCRHKYDGTITNSICHPTVYGILGYAVRQPIGGDFALSRALMKHLVTRSWHRTTEEYGVDIFMTTNAILGGFRVAEVGLGQKVHKPSAPKLGPMFAQVISTLFLMVTRHLHTWAARDEMYVPPLFGLREMGQPQELDMDLEAIKGNSLAGWEEHARNLADLLDDANFKRVESALNGPDVNIDLDLWVDCVWDMIAAFPKAQDKTTIVEALRCLYFGRAYSFMRDTWDMSTADAEKVIHEGAERFRAKRGELIRRLT